MTGVSRQIVLRRGNPADAADIARIMRAALASFDWMPVLRTPDEDLAFITNQVLPDRAVTVAEAGENVVGFSSISIRPLPATASAAGFSRRQSRPCRS